MWLAFLAPACSLLTKLLTGGCRIQNGLSGRYSNLWTYLVKIYSALGFWLSTSWYLQVEDCQLLQEYPYSYVRQEVSCVWGEASQSLSSILAVKYQQQALPDRVSFRKSKLVLESSIKIQKCTENLTYDGVSNAATALSHDPFGGHIRNASLMLVCHIPEDIEQPPPNALSPKSLHHVPVQLQAWSIQVYKLVFWLTYRKLYISLASSARAQSAMTLTEKSNQAV